MLVQEAHEISGLSYEKLNEQLPLVVGDAARYAIGNCGKKARTPHLDRIQELEDKVAGLLKRPAHKVVVEDNLLGVQDPLRQDLSIGLPKSGMSWSKLDSAVLQFGYEFDWPTYRRLKLGGNIRLWAWQYGILWDRGYFQREHFGVPADEPIESFLVRRVHQISMELRLEIQHRLHEGLPEFCRNPQQTVSVL